MAIIATKNDHELLTAIRELAEYLGEDPAVTAFNCGNSFYSCAEAWRASPRETPEQIADYYRSTPSLVHQLVFANYAIPHELDLLRRAAGLFTASDRVLDLGAGVGSMLLAIPSVRSVHADLAGHPLDYARWRYARAEKPVGMVELGEDYSSLDGQLFDGVICTEVIEHVPDPAALVALLAKLVRPGGKLLATWSFHDHDGLCPFHLNLDKWTDESFAGVLMAHGFTAIGRDLFKKEGNP